MRNLIILITLVTSSIFANEASEIEKSLDKCDLKKLQKACSETVGGKKNIKKVHMNNDEQSFCLKVILPEKLLKVKFSAPDIMMCKTFEEENLETFDTCYQEHLEDNEKPLFNKYLNCLKK